MKFASIIPLIGFVVVGQAEPFQNFGFEAVNTDGITFSGSYAGVLEGHGLIAKLIPGWRISRADFGEFSSINYNTRLFGTGIPAIISREARNAPESGWRFQFSDESRIGNYSLAFSMDERSLSLFQTGDVPLDAQRLTFQAARPSLDFHIDMFLDGQPLLSEAIFGSTLISGDVSDWAGKTATLELRISKLRDSSFGNVVALDDFVFVIPEPSTFSVLITGTGLLVGAHLWRRRRKN